MYNVALWFCGSSLVTSIGYIHVYYTYMYLLDTFPFSVSNLSPPPSLQVRWLSRLPSRPSSCSSLSSCSRPAAQPRPSSQLSSKQQSTALQTPSYRAPLALSPCPRLYRDACSSKTRSYSQAVLPFSSETDSYCFSSSYSSSRISYSKPASSPPL